MEDDKRVYVEDWINTKGIQTGQNLKTQINSFRKLKTKTKAIPIVQGRGKKQIIEFTEAMLSQVNKTDMKTIEAFALGNAHGNGFGLIEAISSFMGMESIDKKYKQHIHLLGVTGFDRIIPVLQLIKNGVFKDVKKVSFDSSYHAKTYAFGNLQKSVDWCLNGMQPDKIGLKRNKLTESVFKEIEEFWKDCPAYNIEEFDDFFKYSSFDLDKINTPTRQLKDRDLVAYKKNVNIIQMYVILNMYKYLEVLEKFMNGELSMRQIFHNDKYYKMYNTLTEVKTIEELEDWIEFVRVNYKVANSSVVKSFSDAPASDLLF